MHLMSLARAIRGQVVEAGLEPCVGRLSLVFNPETATLTSRHAALADKRRCRAPSCKCVRPIADVQALHHARSRRDIPNRLQSRTRRSSRRGLERGVRTS